MEFKNNKKGIGFFALTPILMSICFAMVYLSIISPADEAMEEAEVYSNIAKNIDTFNLKSEAEFFFKNEEIKGNIDYLLSKNPVQTLVVVNSTIVKTQWLDNIIKFIPEHSHLIRIETIHKLVSNTNDIDLSKIKLFRIIRTMSEKKTASVSRGAD